MLIKVKGKVSTSIIGLDLKLPYPVGMVFLDFKNLIEVNNTREHIVQFLEWSTMKRPEPVPTGILQVPHRLREPSA